MNDAFDICAHTSAPRRLCMRIDFADRSAESVFDTVGDPAKITDWYLLARSVKMHPPGPDGESRFNVEFVFFGDVYEEVLHWDPPHRYVYKAEGPDFPIRDYVACLEVNTADDGSGTLTWSVYFDEVDGAHFERILPVILPPVTERSAELLAPMIGGTKTSVESNFQSG